MTDNFRTEELRSRVLRAWAESPARFREDANAEEDHALGGYRDRVVVELAQNAADAAARAGVPGRLRLSLRDGVLTAANTGAPLDAAGVEALSTLRASAKRDDTSSVGRFGVGFAAVVAVSDAPSIASATGSGPTPGGPPETDGVEWSAERARAEVRALPSLVEELDRRGGQVPLLRLPFPLSTPVDVPDGYTTVVRLPLRDEAAVESVRAQLAEAGPALMLALPALTEVEIDGRVLTADHAPGQVTVNDVTWITSQAHGAIPPDLLTDRPTEERARPTWQLRWALPPAVQPDVPAVLHAPTPSDERLALPALLIASFPLAPDRRHVAPGPLTDYLVERAADAYVDLLRSLPATPALLDLVPGSMGAGPLDAALRRAILSRLPETPLLPLGETHDHDADADHDATDPGLPGLGGFGPGETERVRGRDAVAIDGPAAFVELLAGRSGGEAVFPGLLAPAWPVRNQALAALGVRRMELADVVDALAGLEREPSWWHGLYESLTGASTDGLGALPVPLADGRVVRGPRSLLVATEDIDPEGLDVLGLRFVEPAAAHPLLFRLGALEAEPRAVLADPAVRAAVEDSFDSDDPDAIADAVLTLVAAAHLDPGDEPWLSELALPATDGELYAAGELLLPDSPLHTVMAEDAPFGTVDDDTLERHGRDALTAAGVLDGFALAKSEDVNLTGLADQAETLHLDAEDQWAEEILDHLGMQDLPPLLPEFQAVRDLELVADWATALRLLSRPPYRSAIVEPAYVALFDGRRAATPSYTAWWLRRQPILDGRRPGEFSLPGGDLNDLYDPAPEGLDEQFLKALGVRTSLHDLLADPDGPTELLNRLADPSRAITRAQLTDLWTALAEHEGALDPPERVRAVVDGELEIVDAADALVLDRPDVLPLLPGQPLVIAAHDHAAALADLLDLPLASEEVTGEIGSTGERRAVPAAVHALLPDAPDTYVAHETLIVDGRPVTWWTGDDDLHASTPEGLARALAWESGRWPDRLFAEAALRAPETLPTLLAERDLE